MASLGTLRRRRGPPIGQNRGVNAEVGLKQLLARLSPQRRPGTYVFVFVARGEPLPEVEAFASVVEAEGVSLVLARDDADSAGLAYDFLAGWVTLGVPSKVGDIGLTAAVSTALADAGISCNVIAGYHHDHLLVPLERVVEALDVLRRLSASHRPRSTP